MVYIPTGAEWYIAELIMEIRIEGRGGNVVHRNLVLVNAASPDEAYEKALELGSSSEISYDNPERELVSIHFRGLSALTVVHDKLEHGAELMYSEEVDVPEEDLAGQIRPKSDLAVFCTDSHSSKALDFRSEEVVRRIEQIAPD